MDIKRKSVLFSFNPSLWVFNMGQFNGEHNSFFLYHESVHGDVVVAEALLSVSGLRMFADTFLSLDWGK